MDFYTALLIFFALYITLSIILLIFPIWKNHNPVKIPHGDCPFIVGGHRGTSEERLENSLPAFKFARQKGIHILEMDVHSTKDGEVVVHHDHCLKRLTGLEKKVSEVKFMQIPKCKKTVQLPFLNGTYTQKEGIDDGRIPLLREVFVQNQGIPMNIDLKGGDEEQLNKVLDMIIEYKREHLTYLGDMSEGKNALIQSKAQKLGIASFSSMGYVLFIVIMYFMGLLPFIRFKYDSVWYPFLDYKEIGNPKDSKILGKIARLFVIIVRTITFFLNPMFYHLRKRGVLIMFWVVNSKQELEKAMKYNIDGVLTDCPDKMGTIINQVLEEKKVK